MLHRIRRQVVPFVLVVLCLFGPLIVQARAFPAEPINVVWIVADDLSPELGCYGYPEVRTPNLDRLAASGIRYTHAFSTAPVCSASRTAFQTGRYQTSIGGHHHETRDIPVLPDNVPTITGLMQKAGYFVSNGRGLASDPTQAKSHLNFAYKPEEFFDGTDWSQRADGQPFFAQVQIKEPHRPFVQRKREYPTAPIPPCYPDHPVTRADWGNYLASIEVLDRKVWAVLDRLDAEGLADNTLVIFFGDHGRPHVRGKQWLYDGGLHVPLIVRLPGKARAGMVHDRLTSLLDVVPTTLAAAGIELPNEVPKLPGVDLLNSNWTGHEKLFAARDRCGDAPGRSRSIRTQDFKYIRNFRSDVPYMKLSSYKKLEYPVETVMKVMHAEGSWTSPFMAATKPAEELYDLRADPYETNNLANDALQVNRLGEFRTSLDRWIKETGDQGEIDESLKVDMKTLMAGKKKWYESTMKERGLDPNLSDAEYLTWWEQELGVSTERASETSVTPTADQDGATTSLRSPSANVAASLSVDDDARLRFNVEFKNAQVVEPSALGITVDGVDLGIGVSLGEPTITSVDETYSTRGNDNSARNHYRQWNFPAKHLASGKEYAIEFRAYDDGVAYRYIVPGDGVQHVGGESSSWTLADGAKAWYFERLTKGWKLKSYAGEWLSTDVGQLDSVSPVGPIQGTPIVLELPNALGYAAITKAATYNYSGMRLKATGERTLVANFTEGDAGFDVEGTITTPWRVTLLADDLNELANSDLIKNLNPAPDANLFADTSYIKPGRTAWSWETLGLGDPATQRDFIDLAAEMGFEYSTVDDGWKDWDSPWDTIKELCDHGREKAVGVWVWVHSEDIRDPANDYQQLQTYFDQVASVGAVGLKIDFMNGESKEMVDFEIAALHHAAKLRLMINFHGCHASTGEERTYPNEMTREGIRGIEVNKMKEGPLPASHNAALPFTRFVVGHADYTPILFTNPGPTTWAHQLATLVTFTTGLQTYAEHPDTMMNALILKDAFPVLQAIPSVWDETQVLEGSEIGKLTAFARRSGDRWFAGILNGEQTAKQYSLNLSFLSDGDYEVTLVSDDSESPRVNLIGLNPKADLHEYTSAVPFKVSHQSCERSQTLAIDLAPGGGFVAQFTKK